MSERDLQDLFPGSVPLVFSGYREKRYAKTPKGEFAFGEHGGLYEWRRMDVGGTERLVRIQYTGGDRQVSSEGRMWTFGRSAARDVPWPDHLGFHAAFDPARMS